MRGSGWLLGCALLLGCSSSSSDGGPRESVRATRFVTDPAGRCGHANAPFTTNDVFTLGVLHPTDVPDGVVELTIEMKGFAAVGDRIQMVVEKTSPPIQEAKAGALTLTARGPYSSPPPELDGAAVTIVRIPTRDGEPMTARLELHFADGRALDRTLSAELTSTFGACDG